MALESENKMPATNTEPNRIQGLDALRGFALWGICVVNLPLIARSFDSYRQIPESGTARAGLFLNSLLFEAKFFTLFSFLFGIGIAVLQRREGTTFLVRRFFGLILLGFTHAILLFPGDILLSYGILGLVFLPLSRMHKRALVVTAIFCLLISAMTYTALGVLSQTNAALPQTNYLGSYATAFASNLHVYPLTLGYVMLFNWPRRARDDLSRLSRRAQPLVNPHTPQPFLCAAGFQRCRRQPALCELSHMAMETIFADGDVAHGGERSSAFFFLCSGRADRGESWYALADAGAFGRGAIVAHKLCATIAACGHIISRLRFRALQPPEL
jgi:hypothetical protein